MRKKTLSQIQRDFVISLEFKFCQSIMAILQAKTLLTFNKTAILAHTVIDDWRRCTYVTNGRMTIRDCLFRAIFTLIQKSRKMWTNRPTQIYFHTFITTRLATDRERGYGISNLSAWMNLAPSTRERYNLISIYQYLPYLPILITFKILTSCTDVSAMLKILKNH